MFNNPYYGSQVSMERIDNQIKELENMRNQLQRNSQPAINQTFQLAPGNIGGIKFVNGIEDVHKELVFADSVFLSKDFSCMWMKNTKGEVKTYEIKEIVQKDEKDLLIEELMARIDKLERGEKDDKSETTKLDKSTTKSVQK